MCILATQRLLSVIGIGLEISGWGLQSRKFSICSSATMKLCRLTGQCDDAVVIGYDIIHTVLDKHAKGVSEQADPLFEDMTYRTYVLAS
jgi:hypothetical protein